MSRFLMAMFVGATIAAAASRLRRARRREPRDRLQQPLHDSATLFTMPPVTTTASL